MKKRLRESLRQSRQLRSDSQIRNHSKKVLQRLDTLLQSAPSCTVSLYYPHAGEIDVLPLMNHPLLKHLNWALPVCIRQENEEYLQFANFKTGGSLIAGAYNIPVPETQIWTHPDWIVVPCLGANRSGYRLGYGAGWYDKTISRLTVKPITVGVVWTEALLDERFEEPHDQSLDWIVTPNELIEVGQS